MEIMDCLCLADVIRGEKAKQNKKEQGKDL